MSFPSALLMTSPWQLVQEDRALVQAHRELGNKWKVIADRVGGRYAGIRHLTAHEVQAASCLSLPPCVRCCCGSMKRLTCLCGVHQLCLKRSSGALQNSNTSGCANNQESAGAGRPTRLATAGLRCWASTQT